MNVHHLTVGARGRLKLFYDDADRRAFLDRFSTRFGTTILGYCLMDTHVHLLVEGDEMWATGELEVLMSPYIRWLSSRRRSQGMSLRGPVVAVSKENPYELMRSIRYLHDNPLKSNPPLVRRPIDYLWSSQREYSGVAVGGIANIHRGKELLGPLASRAIGYVPRLVGLEPATFPTALLEHLIEASAQTFGLLAEELLRKDRSVRGNYSRAVFIQLAGIEGYMQKHLLDTLKRTKSSVARLASIPVQQNWIRMARTLIREPGFRSLIVSTVPEAAYL